MNNHKLPRAVLALGAVSFFTDVSSEMIAPLMPQFLVMLGATALWVGTLEGAADTTASLLKLFSGVWADKIANKKALVVAGYGLSSVARSLMFLSVAPWQVLAFRLSDRVGKGIRTSPRDALLSSAVSSEQRGRAFGFHRAADHAGSVLGSLVAMFLLWLGFSLPGVFAFAVIPAILAMLALIFFVPSTSIEPKEEKKPAAQGALTSPLKRFLVVSVLFALGNSPDALLLLRAQELGVTLFWIPFLWAAFHVVKSVMSVPFGALSDRIGRRGVLLSGFALYSLSYVSFAYAEDLALFCVILGVYGCYYGMTEGVAGAMVADLSTPETRGRAYGFYHASLGLSALPSGLLAGYLWAEYSPATALLTGALFAGAAALLFAVWFAREPTKASQ